MKKLLFNLVIFVGLVANTAAQTFVVNGVNYNVVSAINPYTVEVVAKNPIYTGAVTIPATVANSGTTYSVIRIAQQAFQNCTGLTFVTMPNSVTDIGLSAFAGCTGLTNVVFPNALIYIKSYAFIGCSSLTQINLPTTLQLINIYAFSGCASLTSVTIPASVATIGTSAFAGCTKLTSFTVNGTNATYKSVNGAILTKNGATLVQCPAGVSTFEVPAGVTTVGANSLSECSKLEMVFLPTSLTTIAESAFSNCAVLDTIYCNATTPPAVANANAFTNVPSNAAIFVSTASVNAYKAASHWSNFANIATPPNSFVYSGLKYSMLTNVEPIKVKLVPNAKKYKGNIVIPENINFNYKNYTVTEIRDSAFRKCDSLVSVTMPNSVTIIGEYAFGECPRLTTVVFSTNLKYILDYAFINCFLLKEIILPNSLLELGVSAYYSCYLVKKVSIPASVTKLGYGCFKRLTSLTAFEIDNANANYKTHNGVILSKDGTTLFQCPGNLLDYNIPNSVITIDYGAFSQSNITTLTIPSSVTTIKRGAFFYTYNLESIVLPDNLKVLSTELFWQSSINSAYIPEGVTKIENAAFFECYDLKTLTIPSTVDTIGIYLVSACTSLYCNAVTPPIIDQWTFHYQDKTIPLYVPAGSIAAYKAAPYWSEFTNYNPTLTATTNPSQKDVVVCNPITAALKVQNVEPGNQVELYNVNGALLMKQTVDNSLFEYNTAALTNGIYIVRINQNGVVKSHKVVKQ